MPKQSCPSTPPLTTNAHHSYALNFTRTPYETIWVPLAEVATTRKNLGLHACRTHIDGTDFPTLPILHDRSTTTSSSTQQEGTLIGDSFDIALHLHNTPSSDKQGPPLFPPSTIALHRAWNAHVDELFTTYGAPLAAYYMPLDSATAEASRAQFVRRAGVAKWEDFEIPIGSAERRKMLAAFEAALGTSVVLGIGLPLGAGLATWFVRRDDGPFLEGKTPMYADLIIGGWLQMMRNCLPEWEEVRAWHGGLWGRLFDALEEWVEVK